MCVRRLSAAALLSAFEKGRCCTDGGIYNTSAGPLPHLTKKYYDLAKAAQPDGLVIDTDGCCVRAPAHASSALQLSPQLSAEGDHHCLPELDYLLRFGLRVRGVQLEEVDVDSPAEGDQQEARCRDDHD